MRHSPLLPSSSESALPEHFLFRLAGFADCSHVRPGNYILDSLDIESGRRPNLSDRRQEKSYIKSPTSIAYRQLMAKRVWEGNLTSPVIGSGLRCATMLAF